VIDLQALTGQPPKFSKHIAKSESTGESGDPEEKFIVALSAKYGY
jgi:hypothetical protein